MANMGRAGPVTFPCTKHRKTFRGSLKVKLISIEPTKIRILKFPISLVPTTTSQHHYSFWVRIQCEPFPNQDIKNVQNQRILITIWPLFVCRSLMISNTTILDKSSAINYKVNGYGQSVELPMAGAYDTEHEMIFNSKW